MYKAILLLLISLVNNVLGDPYGAIRDTTPLGYGGFALVSGSAAALLSWIRRGLKGELSLVDFYINIMRPLDKLIKPDCVDNIILCNDKNYVHSRYLRLCLLQQGYNAFVVNVDKNNGTGECGCHKFDLEYDFDKNKQTDKSYLPRSTSGLITVDDENNPTVICIHTKRCLKKRNVIKKENDETAVFLSESLKAFLANKNGDFVINTTKNIFKALSNNINDQKENITRWDAELFQSFEYLIRDYPYSIYLQKMERLTNRAEKTWKRLNKNNVRLCEGLSDEDAIQLSIYGVKKFRAMYISDLLYDQNSTVLMGYTSSVGVSIMLDSTTAIDDFNSDHDNTESNINHAVSTDNERSFQEKASIIRNGPGALYRDIELKQRWSSTIAEACLSAAIQWIGQPGIMLSMYTARRVASMFKHGVSNKGAVAGFLFKDAVLFNESVQRDEWQIVYRPRTNISIVLFIDCIIQLLPFACALIVELIQSMNINPVLIGMTSFDNGILLGISGTGNSIASLVLCSIAIIAWSFLISLSCHSRLITLMATIATCILAAVNAAIIYRTLPFDILITNVGSSYATKIYCEIVIIFTWSIAEIISWGSHDGAWVIESTTFFASAVYNAMLSRW